MIWECAQKKKRYFEASDVIDKNYDLGQARVQYRKAIEKTVRG